MANKSTAINIQVTSGTFSQSSELIKPHAVLPLLFFWRRELADICIKILLHSPKNIKSDAQDIC